MNSFKYLILFIIALWGTQACNNPRGKDSVSLAKKANKAKDTTAHIETRGFGTEEFPVASQLYSDFDFAVDAEDQATLETELGKLSSTNSSNQDIKDFGQMMVKDYKKINDELIALSKRKDIVLPSSPGQKSVKRIKDLIGKTGEAFDKDYINFLISDHKRIISSFENASRQTTDADIKSFVDNTIPLLKNHLTAAKALKDNL